MAQLHPAGYTQAIHLLVGGDLLTDVAQLSCPLAVASGTADTITPPEGCQRVAAAANVPWTDLGDAGHACALDAPGKVSELIGLLPSEKARGKA
jgi:pimeloyl-ACP methyl ester carboxylesterase